MAISSTRLHRKDIDGLRCLAILPVVLFHLKVKGFSGGYVGVDIFFVISGYLITGIVAREMREGSFSFARFYERRVRRIAPALIAMLLPTSAAAVWLLPPADLKRYGLSLLATVFSFSNLYFWSQSSYFSPTFFKLLLHTWSLSVEEQFYIVLPLAIFFLRRRWDVMRAALVAALVLSFALSCWMTTTMPTAAFFAPWSRAWELLIGSLLALFPVKRVFRPITYDVVSLLGLFMTLWALARLSGTVRFPGPMALVPCLGTAMMLFTGEHSTVVGRLLSWRPFVFIGLISYSVYLVHWPLLLLARIVSFHGIGTDSTIGQLLLVVTCVVLGYLSWRYVEAPFRSRRGSYWKTPRIWWAYSFASLAVIVLAAGLVFGEGFPARFPSAANRVLGLIQDPVSSREGTCFITTSGRFDRDFNVHLCTDSDAHRPNFLVLGDSHAAAMWRSFGEAMPHVSFAQINSSGCRMLPANYDVSNCGQARRFAYESYLPRAKPELTILVQRWSEESDVKQIAAIAEWFSKHQLPLIVVGPAQEYSLPLNYLIAQSLRRGDSEFPSRFELQSVAKLDDTLAAECARLGLPYLSLRRPVCERGACSLYVNGDEGQPVMLDNSHLTPGAAKMIVHYWIDHGQMNCVSCRLIPVSSIQLQHVVTTLAGGTMTGTEARSPKISTPPPPPRPPASIAPN